MNYTFVLIIVILTTIFTQLVQIKGQCIATTPAITTNSLTSKIKCYVCDVTFPNKQLYFIDPCQFPTNTTISNLIPLGCNPDQDTCMVVRTRKNGINREITRSCSTSDSSGCSAGCGTSGYGISTTVCTSCCNTDGCNTDNRGVKQKRSIFLIMLFILITINKIV